MDERDISLREAAEMLGTNVKALRQRVRRRGLQLRVSEGKPGESAYVLTPGDVAQLRELPRSPSSADEYVPRVARSCVDRPRAEDGLRVEGSRVEGLSDTPLRSPGSVSSELPETPDASSLARALTVAQQALAASEGFERALQAERAARLQEAERSERALQAEREAVERAGQLERRILALSYELQTYQRSLGEQAESLAQERAKRMALEMANDAPDGAGEMAAVLGDGSGVLGSGAVVSTTRERTGWGKRFRRWFFGTANQERTG